MATEGVARQQHGVDRQHETADTDAEVLHAARVCEPIRLNGVDGVITGYRYTDAFFGVAFAPGKIKDLKGKQIDKPNNLNVELSVRVDGASEDATETLKVAANYDAWEVSEDGQDVTPVEAGTEFSAKSK